MSEEARERLKAGMARFNQLTTQAEELRQAIAAAQRTIEQAQDSLASFGDLDRAIVQFRVAATKAGKDPKALPDSLREQVQARRDAEAELAAAEATLGVLQDELGSCERALEVISSSRNGLCVGVLKELGDELAAELISLNAQRRALVDVLEGLAALNVRIDGSMRFVGLTPTMESAINGRGALSEWPAGFQVETANARRWQQRLDALLADPDAPITAPKAVTPRDVRFEPTIPGIPTFTRRFSLADEER